MVHRKITDNVQPSSIRNISIISHVDHGKTTLSDHLIASGGMLPQHLAGSLRALDYLDSEQERGITIEPSIVSFQIDNNGNSMLVNLIDTPGHVDFSGKVTEALHLVDNGLILIDAVEGVMSQTVTVIHQAIRENLTLVLFINKIDRLITELQFTQYQIKQRIERIIGEVYAICERQHYKGKIPTFSNNRVVIGSALDGWAVDIDNVAEIGKIDGIMSWYQDDKTRDKQADLTKVFDRVFRFIFSGPCEDQLSKYNSLTIDNNHDGIESTIDSCTSDGELIILAGKKVPLDQSRKVQVVVRFLSGRAELGMHVYSSIMDKSIKIEEMYYFRGRRTIKVESGTVGHIIGIVFSENPPIGDVLSEVQRKIPTKEIYYLQKPVISVSIEPVNFSQYDELVSELEFICQLNPGVTLTISQDTGELLLSSIGTLQLEIIVQDIEDAGFELITSNPQVIEYLMPTKSEQVEFNIDGWQVKIHPYLDEDDNHNKVFHENNNLLTIDGSTSEEFDEGLVETFRRSLRDPVEGIIRNLEVNLIQNSREIDLSFEDGIVLASRVIKLAKNALEFRQHEPYYVLTIYTSKEYVGNIVNLLQQYQGLVKDITSTQTSKIQAEIPIVDMGSLSDQLRQVSDGNIIWNIEDTEYREK